MDMVHRGILEEMLNQNFERWSRSDTLMKALIGRIVNNKALLVPVPAFEKRCAIKVIREKLNSEQKVTKELMSISHRSPSAAAGTPSGEESNARRLHHKRRN